MNFDVEIQKLRLRIASLAAKSDDAATAAEIAQLQEQVGAFEALAAKLEARIEKLERQPRVVVSGGGGSIGGPGPKGDKGDPGESGITTPQDWVLYDESGSAILVNNRALLVP